MATDAAPTDPTASTTITDAGDALAGGGDAPDGVARSPFADLASARPVDPDRPPLDVTDRARDHLLELLALEDDADQLALRVEVTGHQGSEFTYDLLFDRRDAAVGDDAAFEVGGLAILIPAESVRRLRGSVLDLPGEGLVLRNPNRPSPYGDAAELGLTGSVEARIERVLEQLVNPGIAGHGGYTQLVSVEGDTAYMLMGGGCQGCGLAQATLTAGIEAAVVDAVPEIRRVVDVTDHAAGERPYYSPA